MPGWILIDCVGVLRHLNPCGSFCVVSQRKGKKEIEEIVEEMKREEQGRKRNRNEREETEEIKPFFCTLTCYKDSRPCPTVSQYQLNAPVT